MSEAQKAGARKRWDECREAAERLGCGKTHVHDRLYSRMKAEGFLERVLCGEQDAIEAVRAWPEFNEERPTLWKPSPATPTGMELVKLAIWFVGKCGGFAKAKKALDFAERVDEDLS